MKTYQKNGMRMNGIKGRFYFMRAQATQFLYKKMKRGEVYSTKELAAMVGCSTQTARKYISWLRRSKKVKKWLKSELWVKE